MFAWQQHEEVACCRIPDNPSPAGVGNHLDPRIVLQLKAVARKLCYSVEYLGNTPVRGDFSRIIFYRHTLEILFRNLYTLTCL